jgi:hypothetical protein
MSATDLLIYIGDIDDKYIKEAAPNYTEYTEITIVAKQPIQKRIIRTIMQFAACIALFAIAVVFIDLRQGDTVITPGTDVSSWSVITDTTNDFTDTTTTTEAVGISETPIILPNYIPDGFVLEAIDTIHYDDKSEKSFEIYTNGEKVFFISLLTNISVDVSASENEIDPFDIFAYANIDDKNIKDGDEILKTWTVEETQFIIFGDVTKEEAEKIKNSMLK